VEQRRQRDGMFDHELDKIDEEIQRKGDGSV